MAHTNSPRFDARRVLLGQSLAAAALALLLPTLGMAGWPTGRPGLIWRPAPPAPVPVAADPEPIAPPADCPCRHGVQAPTPEDAVRQVLDAQAAAWNKGDLDGFMAGYWSSPELSFFSGGTRTRGWQATLDRYRQRYQAEGKEMGRLSFGDVEIELLGPDAALVRGHWKLEMSKDKPEGLFTLIFKRLPEGWRIVHDHTSRGP
jgi:beta-aspartyl-peptidase (threonine type)